MMEPNCIWDRANLSGWKRLNWSEMLIWGLAVMKARKLKAINTGGCNGGIGRRTMKGDWLWWPRRTINEGWLAVVGETDQWWRVIGCGGKGGPAIKVNWLHWRWWTCNEGWSAAAAKVRQQWSEPAVVERHPMKSPIGKRPWLAADDNKRQWVWYLELDPSEELQMLRNSDVVDHVEKIRYNV